MQLEEFAAIVVEHVPALSAKGYQRERLEMGDEGGYVEFEKELIPGVRCIIQFQWFPYLSKYEAGEPMRFQLSFIRLRSPEYAGESHLYGPLNLGLRNIIIFEYGVNPPPVGGDWKFTTESELVEQLGVVQDLILRYGIPWLEDPDSNIDSVKRSKDRTT